jgi:dTDP-glucose 4,6-dehydratase
MRFVADRPGHDRRYAIDITKIRHDLGWQPRQSLGSGLSHTIEWYLSHPEWVRAIRQQQEYQKWLERNYTQRGEVTQ